MGVALECEHRIHIGGPPGRKIRGRERHEREGRSHAGVRERVGGAHAVQLAGHHPTQQERADQPEADTR